MKGQTLIEVLIALTVAVIAISAVTITSISSLSNAQFIKDQDAAAKYAQEGMETIRKIRNSNYADFATRDGVYCLDSDQTSLPEVPDNSCTVENVGEKFIRLVRIQRHDCADDVSKVTVTVSYSSGKCKTSFCHSSQLISCLSTVNPVTGP